MLANARDYQECYDRNQNDEMDSREEITDFSNDSLIAIDLMSVFICLSNYRSTNTIFTVIPIVVIFT